MQAHRPVFVRRNLHTHSSYRRQRPGHWSSCLCPLLPACVAGKLDLEGSSKCRRIGSGLDASCSWSGVSSWLGSTFREACLPSGKWVSSKWRSAGGEELLFKAGPLNTLPCLPATFASGSHLRGPSGRISVLNQWRLYQQREGGRKWWLHMLGPISFHT